VINADFPAGGDSTNKSAAINDSVSGVQTPSLVRTAICHGAKSLRVFANSRAAARVMTAAKHRRLTVARGQLSCIRMRRVFMRHAAFGRCFCYGHRPTGSF
jgi:hypothetical protein